MKRYRIPLLLLILNIIFGVLYPIFGISTLNIMKMNLSEMLSVMPPIFIILGLLDVWVERSTLVKFMGEGSGVKGSVLAFVMGSVAAGPLYAAFPIAAMLIKKGAKFQNVCLFLGVWSTTKIPMLLFESANLGLRYTTIRFVCNIIGISIVAALMEITTSKEDKMELIEHVNQLESE
ncbi:permease [Chakrabartyella piscis]|uniref:permease n=1 Tax=Chakrabartyella piscis TaxID=2918914 RepID=UPI00295838A6|nr:permease [Chakrabartyella piscis]